MPRASTTKADKPPTVASWKRLIKDIQNRALKTSDPDARAILQLELTAAYDGLKETQRSSAVKEGFVTGTNLSALTSMVIMNGPTFSARVPATDAPHLKRCMQAGLLEPAGSGMVRLTSEGRTRVGDEIINKLARGQHSIDGAIRGEEARLKMEAALAALR